MEILLYYVLPSAAVFGSLYLVARAVGYATWYVIENYDRIKGDK